MSVGGGLADWWCHCNRSETSRCSMLIFVPALWLPRPISHSPQFMAHGPVQGLSRFLSPSSHSIRLPVDLLLQEVPFNVLYVHTPLYRCAHETWIMIFGMRLFTFLLFTESFPSANKYAGISAILEKCLLLTQLPLTAISRFVWFFFFIILHPNSSKRLSILVNACLFPLTPHPPP